MTDIAPPLILLTDPDVTKGYAAGREAYFASLPHDPLTDSNIMAQLSRASNTTKPQAFVQRMAQKQGYHLDSKEDRQRWQSWYIGYVFGQLSGAISPYRTEAERRDFLIDELLKPFAGSTSDAHLKQHFLHTLAFFHTYEYEEPDISEGAH